MENENDQKEISISFEYDKNNHLLGIYNHYFLH